MKIRKMKRKKYIKMSRANFLILLREAMESSIITVISESLEGLSATLKVNFDKENFVEELKKRIENKKVLGKIGV